MAYYTIEENLRCFRCGSPNVGPLFERTVDPFVVRSRANGREYAVDEEFYLVHYDCLCCSACKAWDFADYDQWHAPILIGGFTCTQCGGTRLTVTENDVFLSTFQVQCPHCGQDYELEKEKAEEL